MREKFINYSIVNGHAATEISDDELDGGFFFDALEQAYDISPRNDIKIVLGDFNAQVGKEAVNFPATGTYSLHNLKNDSGSRLIQFAVSQNMITGSTIHPHKDIHKCTWRLSNGVTFNQTDHVLIERRHKSNLGHIEVPILIPTTIWLMLV